MRRTETLLKGLIVKETEIFFSRKLDHIEICVTTLLFGRWLIKEESREVYIPDLKTLENGAIRVIADAFVELDTIARRLNEFDSI